MHISLENYALDRKRISQQKILTEIRELSYNIQNQLPKIKNWSSVTSFQLQYY